MERTREDNQEDLKSIIGKNARAARRKLWMTQSEAAAQIDITSEFYARIERGHALPSLFTLIGMAKALHTSTDRLLGITRNPANPAGDGSSAHG